MKYRVFDTIKKRYVTEDNAWILKPDGSLSVNDHGDEIGCPHCTVEFSTGLLDANNNEIFQNDLIDFGGEILIVYWNGEVFGWQARKICSEHYLRFPAKDWHYVDLGWIAAEIPCVGKMTTQIVGNINENKEYEERISQVYYSMVF